MSVSEKIASVLPGLRRYARALTGDQTMGDALIAAVLRSLVTGRARLPETVPVEIALYRMFLRLLGDHHIDVFIGLDGMGPSRRESMADKRLSQISPRPRQAYLLCALEGFSINNAALALDVSPQEVSNLVEQANREMIDQVATDVLIIEDEPVIALDLKEIMIGLGHNITAVARTHREALSAISERSVGLVLADIQLADGSSGLEAVNDILTHCDVPTIFITAFPERLLTGRRPEPTFLITKPFQPEHVKAITSQALFFDIKAQPSDDARLPGDHIGRLH